MRVLILFLGFLFTCTAASASVSGPFSLPTHQVENSQASTKKGQKLQEKLKHLIAKKLYKNAKRKAKKEGLAKPMATFSDFAAVAGAIICLLGILSLITALLGGLVMILIGLLIYTLARNAGGTIKGVFS